jgi:multidrug transporter EmrE-like cation transporter
MCNPAVPVGFSEPATAWRMYFLCLIVVGIIGLMVTAPETAMRQLE